MTKLYGRYTFSLVFTDDAILPEYKGSTFRGIFGHSPKKVVCARKNKSCADCLLKEKCMYFRAFEIPFAGDVRVGAPVPTSKITVRLKFENNLHAELPFHVLAGAMLRRISSLENFHGEGVPPLDYRGLVARAQLVATESSTVKWFEWKRL